MARITATLGPDVGFWMGPRGFGDAAAARLDGIDDSDQFNVIAGRHFLGVKTAQAARSDNGDAEGFH